MAHQQERDGIPSEPLVAEQRDAGSKDPANIRRDYAYIPRIFVTVATREIATI